MAMSGLASCGHFVSQHERAGGADKQGEGCGGSGHFLQPPHGRTRRVLDLEPGLGELDRAFDIDREIDPADRQRDLGGQHLVAFQLLPTIARTASSISRWEVTPTFSRNFRTLSSARRRS